MRNAIDRDFIGCVEADFANLEADGIRGVSMVLKALPGGRIGPAEKAVIDSCCRLLDRLADGATCFYPDRKVVERVADMVRLAVEIESAAAALPTVAASLGIDEQRGRPPARTRCTAIEFDGDDVAGAVKRLVQNGPWSGTPSELLEALNEIVPEATQKLRSWPKTATALGSRMARLIPALSSVGITARRSAVHAARVWTIEAGPADE